MSDFIVLGTDTDAGKTTFALLWMAAFGSEYVYWKPVETGESDTERVWRLFPPAVFLEPVARLTDPVAPPLAARREGRTIPSADKIAAMRPSIGRPLLIETFGGPLSPLNETELQVELVWRLAAPAVLVASSAIGAVGRSLAVIRVLRSEGIDVRAVVLVGPSDTYAEEEIRKHGRIAVVALRLPAHCDADGFVTAASEQRDSLERLRTFIDIEARASIDTNDLLRRDRAATWHPYTSLQDPDPPLPVVGARDEFLELADGRQIIDGISSWWTILHGHRHLQLVQALRRASEQIDHVLFAGATHPFGVECAEELLKTAPWPNGRVFFSDNGSTAVEVALKMAYQLWCHRGEPQRKLFVAFENCYHGDTFGAMAVSRDPVFFGRFEPLLFRTAKVPVQADLLDQFLSLHPSEVAAVIIEPIVQAAGGMRFQTPQILRDIHAVARRHNVLFIADEVMSAFRTGTFWAHSQAGVTPDLICAAKTLAGGVLPLAATLASPEIVAAFDTADRTRTFFHGHSFTGHPLACAVAAENLKMMASGIWQKQVRRIQLRWGDFQLDEYMKEIEFASSELCGQGSVRVCGSVLALDVGSGGYLAEVGRKMRAAAIEAGVLLRPLGNVLYAMPPLDTSDESLDRIVKAMQAAVRAAGG
jgi:adenosylmethionine-8-amino-7-oxononanoate aminotransferase